MPPPNRFAPDRRNGSRRPRHGEARRLLHRAAGQLRPGGLLLIHDYFPDAPANGTKGTLYDLNMLFNTFDGRCHPIADLAAWLAEAGVRPVRLLSLPSDTGLIVAGGMDAGMTRPLAGRILKEET